MLGGLHEKEGEAAVRSCGQQQGGERVFVPSAV